ncbi:calcium/sodium antiporter [soil metagenome]
MVLLVAGLVLLVGGAELLVRGAAHLAVAIGISPLVVGLTVVAFGTGAPELAVGVQAGVGGQTELALGNVVGSNLVNTFLILGLAALVAPLLVQHKLVRREVPLVIVATVVVWLLVLDGGLSPTEGLGLFAAAIAYTAWAVIVGRREPSELAAGPEIEAGDGARARHWVVDVGLIAGGLVLLVLGSNWLVDGAVRIAESLGLSELVIGLTVVAIGTSLPEAATSVVAALKGERDIAVGNIIGSNLFNLLAVLGLSALVSPDGIPAPDRVVDVDLPALIGAAVLCLAVFFTGWVIARWEGALCVGLYAAYLTYLLLDTGETTSTDSFRPVLAVVLPIVVLVVVVDTVAKVRAGNPAEALDGVGEGNEAEARRGSLDP